MKRSLVAAMFAVVPFSFAATCWAQSELPSWNQELLVQPAAVRPSALPVNYDATEYYNEQQAPNNDVVPSPSDRLLVDQPVTGCNDVCYQCDDCCVPNWEVTLGAVFLERSRPRGSVILTQGATGAAAAGATVFNSNTIDAGVETGYRLGLVRPNVRGSAWDLEANYFGVSDWDESAQFNTTTPGATALAFAALPANAALEYDAVRGNFTSELHSLEFNLRKGLPCHACTTVFFGFRWIQLNEELTFQGTASTAANTAAGGNNDTTGLVRTFNDLYGLNLGVDSIVWTRGNLDVRLLAKFGFYIADSHEKAGAVANTTGVLLSETNSTTGQTAFSGEIYASALYHFNDQWAFELGYQLMWIEGVATVFSQTPGAARVDTTGSPFYHGALANVIFTY